MIERLDTPTRVWRPSLRLQAFRPCSLVIQFVDVFTGDDPIERPRLVLERERSSGAFVAVRQKPAVSARGLLAYFGLEHRKSAAGLAPVRYRISIESDLYIANFRKAKDFETTLVAPYDDVSVPASPPAEPLRIDLVPSPAYRFEPFVPVVHGLVVDSNGRQVPDALVSESTNASVLTDAQGSYSLPLRLVPAGKQCPIDARDRLGRTGTALITLPSSLYSSVTITLTDPRPATLTRHKRSSHA